MSSSQAPSSQGPGSQVPNSSGSNSPAGSPTGSVAQSQSGSGTITAAPTSTGATGTASSSINSIPQTAAAGGILMTQPPQTASASYYKIAPSNYITFAWNFTSLLVQPTALTVSAVCGANGFTYPVGGERGDGIIAGTATSVVWDPYGYLQSPGALNLAQETYTLHINDERGPTALGTPGMFQAYSGLKFALYKPKDPTPLSDWRCSDCNDAYSFAPHPAVVAAFATFLVMFLGGWNVLRRGIAAR